MSVLTRLYVVDEHTPPGTTDGMCSGPAASLEALPSSFRDMPIFQLLEAFGRECMHRALSDFIDATHKQELMAPPLPTSESMVVADVVQRIIDVDTLQQSGAMDPITHEFTTGGTLGGTSGCVSEALGGLLETLLDRLAGDSA